MRFEYQLSYDDFHEFAWHYLRWVRWVGVGLSLTGLFFGVLLVSLNPIDPVALTFLIVFGPLTILAYFYCHSLCRFLWRATSVDSRGPIILEANAEGLHTETLNCTSRMKWTYFSQAKERGQLFVLYAGKHNVILIPKRVFPYPEDEDAFRALVREHVSWRKEKA